MPNPIDPADWPNSADPRGMLALLFPLSGMDSTPDMPVRLRRYLIALARRQWDRLPWVARCFVRHAERIADGWTPDLPAHTTLCRLANDYAHAGADRAVIGRVEAALRADWPVPGVPADDRTFAQPLARLAMVAVWKRGNPDLWVDPNLHNADLLRDVFQPPLYRASFSPMWRTTTVERLAQRMDETGEYGAMPVLADALQAAGCEERTILDHCRDRHQPHVRGCWVVDAILLTRRPAATL